MRRPHVSLIPALLVIAVLLSACKPFEAAWRTTSAVQAAATLTDKAIAGEAVKAHHACLKTTKVATAEYKSCIEAKPAYQALLKWNSYAKPAINAALIGTVTALQIAERSKAAKLNWQDIIKPAGCALAKMLDEFSALLPPAVKSAIAMVKAVTCE